MLYYFFFIFRSDTRRTTVYSLCATLNLCSINNWIKIHTLTHTRTHAHTHTRAHHTRKNARTHAQSFRRAIEAYEPLQCVSLCLVGISIVASVLTIVCMAFDRYFAIRHPMRNRQIFTVRRVKQLILVTWFLAAILVVPLLVVRKVCVSGVYELLIKESNASHLLVRSLLLL